MQDSKQLRVKLVVLYSGILFRFTASFTNKNLCAQQHACHAIVPSVMQSGCLGTDWMLGCADARRPVATACSQCVCNLPFSTRTSMPSTYVDFTFCTCMVYPTCRNHSFADHINPIGDFSKMRGRKRMSDRYPRQKTSCSLPVPKKQTLMD